MEGFLKFRPLDPTPHTPLQELVYDRVPPTLGVRVWSRVWKTRCFSGLTVGCLPKVKCTVNFLTN